MLSRRKRTILIRIVLWPTIPRRIGHHRESAHNRCLTQHFVAIVRIDLTQQSRCKHRRRHFVVATVILIAMSIGIWDWPRSLRDVLFPKRWGVVHHRRLYRSGQISRWLVKRTLQKHGIDVIIDLQATDINSRDQTAERIVAKELGIECYNFPLGGDGTGEIANYAKAIQAIDTAVQTDKRVLVHCAAGSQRTGGVIASYRMLVENVRPDVAQSEMEEFNWDPVEDTELSDYLNSHMAELARLLVEMDVIENVPLQIPQLNTVNLPTIRINVPRISQDGKESTRR